MSKYAQDMNPKYVQDMSPMNLGFLRLNATVLKGVGEVTSLNTFVSSVNDFHPEGLFSTEIFGRVGTPERFSNYGYINLKTTCIHPTIFKELTKARTLYTDIMSGNSYAKWDDKNKDFIPADMETGETGFGFFVRHIKDLKVPATGSVSRNNLIALMDRYNDQLLIQQLMIIPAGLRDYTVDAAGVPSSDEINKMYRRVLSNANVIPKNARDTDKSLDSPRYNQQVAIAEIDKYISDIIFGKHKFINEQWTKRSIHGGTRNVLTALQSGYQDLDDPSSIMPNETMIGLFQFMKSSVPLFAYHLANGFMSKVFPGEDVEMVMTNKKTLKKVSLPFIPKLYDSFMTLTGANNLINSFGIDSNRDLVLEYKDLYYGLIYLNDNEEYMLLQDIDELPEGANKEHVRPLKLIDLFYVTAMEYSDETPALITRYPVLGQGGVYPTMLYLKPTTETEVRYETSISGRTGKVLKTFPLTGSGYFNSISVDWKHIGGLGADFDGDMVSTNTVLTEESKTEIKDLLASARYYKNATGGMVYSGHNDMNELMIKTMTM